MEDLSDVLKRNFCSLYKQKTETFGTVSNRVTKMNEKRKINRHDAVFEKRKIPENMSPIVTPLPKREKTIVKQEQPIKKEQPINKRLEMLAKWKVDKEKRKALEKKSSKPLFKVTHVPVNVGLPNLEKVNMEIKGKPFKSKFAPPNHKFKPPSNIKPIHFTNTNTNATTEEKINKREKTEELARHKMVTRSQTRSIPSTSAQPRKNRNESKQKGLKTKTKPQNTDKQSNTSSVGPDPSRVKKQENVQPTVNNDVNNTSSGSIDYPLENAVHSNEQTPEKTEPPPYVSPFVTISRGKDSARKEYAARRSRQSLPFKSDTPDCTSPRAGARYFQWLLDQQISRLQGLCEDWTTYKNNGEIPEEATSMIDVAIGQTTLLLTKKFMQFQGLIDKCVNNDSDTPVTCEDLHGFWDMIHLQVDNLNKRFDNLNNLRAHNWQEIVPEVEKKVVKKKGKSLKNAKASAGLKQAIQAARRKKQQNLETSVLKTPQRSSSSNRLSCMKTVENDHRNSSPGLMMMKVAQYAKSVETPAKSILKTDHSKSDKCLSKTVLFQDEIEIDNLENDSNALNIQSKVKTPRRSLRLSKSKLF